MSVVRLSRREALALGLSATSSLVLGCSLFSRKRARPGPGEPAELNAFVIIGADDTVTVRVPEAEMGQGVLTAVAMVIAEELGADFARVRAEPAPARREAYGRQSTGGSTTIRDGFTRLRTVGATARALLVEAAARRWQVPSAEVKVERGVLLHPATSRRLTFGEAAPDAATLEPPKDPALRDPRGFEIIGKPMPRLDLRPKVDGTALFGIDIASAPKTPGGPRRPGLGLLVGLVARAPTFGGKVSKFDAARALAVPGVREVFEIPSGVIVLADHFWAAQKGRDALEVEWDLGPNAALSSASIRSALAAGLDGAREVKARGDAPKVLATATRRIEATYELPFLAHAPMEPLNCTVELGEERCDIWVGSQSVTGAVELAREVTGLDEEQVFVHSTFLGGGFGRRSKNDFVLEALHAARRAKKPVQIVWTREDDIRGGYYRPTAVARMSGAVDEKGLPVAWVHALCQPTILGLKDGVDPFALEGAANLPYAIPNFSVRHAAHEVGVPTWFWRSVGNSLNGFFTECFLDELAALGGRDPVELRLALLGDHPRHKRVLELAAEKSGFGGTLPEGRARGVALHESFGSIAAEVAEVSLEGDGRVRVHRVTAVLDCGQVVNPNTVVAQMESGIIYGLSAALYGEITLESGRVRERNFGDYPVLRAHEVPVIETHLSPSGDAHGGVGEPGTPPIAAAVANAVFKLTGKPVRKLPLTTRPTSVEPK